MSLASTRVPSRITMDFIALHYLQTPFTCAFRISDTNLERSPSISDKDLELNVELAEEAVGLDGVEIVADRIEDEIASTRMSTVDVPIAEIQKLPALFGETDILKALQLLPGVQAGSEGSSGLYVRGGGPDQNLILLDGAPVYNASHIFGFFSVFNPEALQNITMIKGGFPSRYGGRLSSVLDISMKEGQPQKIRNGRRPRPHFIKADRPGPDNNR